MKHAIGIDFGGTTIKSGLVRGGDIVHREMPLDTQALGGPEHIVDALAALIAAMRGREPSIAAVGIGLPGLVDSIDGVVHELTNVQGWSEVPLRQILHERTGLPVTIENDAKSMAYGESKYGAARDGKNIVCVTLGTGVGGACIFEGRLYRGAQLGAGEIGHMSIDYRGRPGPFGNFGCLEEYIGNAQIAQRAMERYREAGSEVPSRDCTPLALEQAANVGDPIALQLWNDIGVELGTALASVVWLLNPDTIVIGGGVSKAGPILFDPVRKTIASSTAPVIHENLRVVPAELGNDAGIIGCAALAVEAAA